MVSSTPLVEILGDGAWADLLAWYERTLIAEFEGYGGKVVQQGGDGFFVIFNDAEAGLDCAVAIQQTLAAHRHDHGFAPRVRIGLHTADALRRGDDYAGLSVHAAARIAAGADAEQIVASRQTIMAGGKGREVSEPRKVMLKGLSGPVEVVTVAWR
jgi:class 3 adenylate cyclase